MLPEAAKEPIALFDIFCGFPAIQNAELVIDTKSFVLYYLSSSEEYPAH
jgi:hypothetical protein